MRCSSDTADDSDFERPSASAPIASFTGQLPPLARRLSDPGLHANVDEFRVELETLPRGAQSG